MTPPDDPLVVAVHWDETQQTIRGFGASGAWSTQFVGTWPSAKKNQVADWLFGQEKDPGGQPEGIGLSIWRFNVGAGTRPRHRSGALRGSGPARRPHDRQCVVLAVVARHQPGRLQGRTGVRGSGHEGPLRLEAAVGGGQLQPFSAPEGGARRRQPVRRHLPPPPHEERADGVGLPRGGRPAAALTSPGGRYRATSCSGPGFRTDPRRRPGRAGWCGRASPTRPRL